MALYLAYKRDDLPWYVRLASIFVAAYALSPIDLIPDFIPVLGYLDDIILLPLFISLVIRLIPKDIMDECRAQAEIQFGEQKPKSRIAAAVIVFIWLCALAAVALIVFT